MSSVYTLQVQTHGLGLSMTMMIDRVPRGARVLDVGCASGYLADPLRDLRGVAYVDGVELDPRDAAIARQRCREVTQGSAEDPATWRKLKGPYDAILFGDVLEHLRDPAAALKAARPLLAPGGVVISSVPNVAHYSIRAHLLEGRFDYADSGILDRTHLRFFTRATLCDLFRDNGYEVRSCDPALKMPERLVRWAGPELAQRVGRLRDKIFAFQYITVAAPSAQAAAGPSA
jgi:2-polyprenyl-3-methyl-5-hydroxy-6-metoxy-1,4-benzoquinol methylase